MLWTGSLFSQNAVVNAWHSHDGQHNIQWENPNLCCTCITVLPVTTVSRSDNSLLWDEGPGAHQRPIAPTSDQDQVRKFTWKSAAAKILWNYKLWENTLKKLSKLFWEILNQVQHLFPHRFCPLAEKKEDPRQLAQQSQQKWEEDACFRSSWDVSYLTSLILQCLYCDSQQIRKWLWLCVSFSEKALNHNTQQIVNAVFSPKSIKLIRKLQRIKGYSIFSFFLFVLK